MPAIKVTAQIGAAVLAALSAGSIVAHAASLAGRSDEVGAAQAMTTACQTAPINIMYHPSFSAVASGYVLEAVSVSGISASCYGATYALTVSGAVGSLATTTGRVPGGEASFVSTLSAPVRADLVTSISITVVA